MVFQAGCLKAAACFYKAPAQVLLRVRMPHSITVLEAHVEALLRAWYEQRLDMVWRLCYDARSSVCWFHPLIANILYAGVSAMV